MVEPLLYAALGFLVASLLGLFVCRAVWGRAVRLTTQRVQRRLPLSREEVIAGRDLLRAEHAVETRRLERHAEALQARMTASLVDLGRSRAALASLGRDLAENRMATGTAEAREDDIRRQLDEVSIALADRSAALARVEEERDQAIKTAAGNSRGEADLQAELDTRRVEIAALNTQIENLRSQHGDLARELAEARELLAERNDLLSATQEAFARETARAEEAEARAQAIPLQADAPSVDPESLAALRDNIESLAGEIARSVGHPLSSAKEPDVESKRPALRAAMRAVRKPAKARVPASTEG